MNKINNRTTSPPIIVGGVGGSGTRLIVGVLKSFGVFMGDDLNSSNDNMALARNFYKIRNEIHNHSEKEFLDGNNIPDRIISPIIEGFLSISSLEREDSNIKVWGWKVPGNFLLLNHYASIIDNYKYIHVIRHGLDMAFSSNQNQVKKWGPFFGINLNEMSLPQASYKYWLKINNYVNNKCLKERPNNYYLLNFDKLVVSPEKELKNLSEFLNIKNSDNLSACELIKTPKSIGRYKDYNINIFNQNDLKELTKFGFTY